MSELANTLDEYIKLYSGHNLDYMIELISIAPLPLAQFSDMMHEFISHMKRWEMDDAIDSLRPSQFSASFFVELDLPSTRALCLIKAQHLNFDQVSTWSQINWSFICETGSVECKPVIFSSELVQYCNKIVASEAHD